jgi:ubiquitin C-terminal hydrolase
VYARSGEGERGDAGLVSISPFAASHTHPEYINSFVGPDGMYEYDLFAVINHEGQMNNGHYTNFARFGDEVTFSYSVCARRRGSCHFVLHQLIVVPFRR